MSETRISIRFYVGGKVYGARGWWTAVPRVGEEIMLGPVTPEGAKKPFKVVHVAWGVEGPEEDGRVQCVNVAVEPVADADPAPPGDDGLRFLTCEHAAVTGGNDYQLCTDCGLQWDYRRGWEGYASAVRAAYAAHLALPLAPMSDAEAARSCRAHEFRPRYGDPLRCGLVLWDDGHSDPHYCNEAEPWHTVR